MEYRPPISVRGIQTKSVKRKDKPAVATNTDKSKNTSTSKVKVKSADTSTSKDTVKRQRSAAPAKATVKRQRKPVQRLVDEVQNDGSSDTSGTCRGTASGFRGIKVDKVVRPLPTRKKNGDLVFKDWPDFHPNLTPAEVLKAGSFGGTYFRPIHSSLTGETYETKDAISEYPEEWFEGLAARKYSRAKYDVGVNRYGVKCGGDLNMWESSGWMSDADPYGWFQWYCRFYLGRRCSDDTRQVGRGQRCFGPTGRWKGNLCGKVSRAGRMFDDATISPVVRQTLQHWGFRLTEEIYHKYCKGKGLPCVTSN